TGEPIAALKKVGRFVKSIHCKDGKWAKNPGKEWGQEVALGEGDVGMENYLRTLLEIGYDGPLTIEREIPQEPERQKAEIGKAIKLLSELRKKVLAESGAGFQPAVTGCNPAPLLLSHHAEPQINAPRAPRIPVAVRRPR